MTVVGGALEGSLLLGQARELASYQSEPRQMRSGMPGKHGRLSMAFERREHRTALVHLDRRAPLLVQKALYWDETMPDLACVFVIHTSGSVLQGDRFDIDVRVGHDARAHVTTQAATKVHEMDANYAAQSVNLDLEHRAYLEYMPGVLIPHRHARYISRTVVTIPADATALLAEIVMPGRKHQDPEELFEYDVFSSTVTASRPDGTPLFTEKILIEPLLRSVRDPGVMGQFDVVANVLLLAPELETNRVFEAIEPTFDLDTAVAAGASRLPTGAGLVYRVLGMETQPVRATVRTFWNLVRETVIGTPLPQEFLWR